MVSVMFFVFVCFSLGHITKSKQEVVVVCQRCVAAKLRKKGKS